MARIGLSVAKVEGRSPHGHRHAYGRRLTRAGVQPEVVRKAMHHLSLNSQKPYTAPGIADVSLALTSATQKLEELATSGQVTQPFAVWDDILKGLEDTGSRWTVPKKTRSGKH